MNGPLIAGIDVGTTGTKVVAFDTGGTPLASGYVEYACTYPRPGWVEQDPNMLVEAVGQAARRMFAAGTVRPDQITAVSVSAQRCCCVFVDKAGQPLKMISWQDNRPAEEVEEIAARIGRDEFYDIVGLPLCGTWMLPKILHTRRHDPRLWEQTHKVVQLQDLILRSLGCESFVSDRAEAPFYGAWDSRVPGWSKTILDAFDLSESLFPPVRSCGEPAGRLDAAAARRTGFAQGTLLCVGIGDQNSAALGAGIVRPGTMSVSIGTGGIATALLEQCYRDPARNNMITHHAVDGRWTFEGLQNAAAGVFRWFRDQLGAAEQQLAAQNGTNVYDELNKLIAQSPAGANGLLLLPHFAGASTPYWNSDARGAWLGLSLAHTRGDMARACIEGITLEEKDIITSIRQAGARAELVRIMGGATKSPVWNQVQADVYGLPCETLKVTDAAVMGAAICAASGAGLYGGLEEATLHMVHPDRRYEPDPAASAVYQELFGLYRDAYKALEQSRVFPRLTALAQNGPAKQ